MNRRFLWLSLLAGAVALGPAQAAPAAPYPAQAGPEISAGTDFDRLFRILADQGAIRAGFTESRWFPFRTRPVILKGEMRFARDLGLSLHYTTPEEQTVIADAGGLLLRDGRGRSRAIPPDPRMPDIGGTLVPIFRFDAAELFRKFRVRAVRAGDAWRIDFAPRAPDVARWVGTIIVEGTGETVRHIEFRRSASQRIDIEIGAAATGVSFSADERRRYFR